MERPECDEINFLYKAHIRELFAYARHFGFSKEVAMDAIHDVFCRVIAQKEQLSEIRNVRAYLLQSLKNRLLNIYKSEVSTVELPTGNDSDELPFTLEVTIEDVMIQQEEDEKIRRKVEKLLQSLTDRQREIIYLRYMQELEYEEIAKIMNITEPACRKLVHKAIAKMREVGVTVILLCLYLNF
ncbi:MAG: sigma-70 family RNA polymerase sigma factor [Tannerella sp.]|jgi:RNA polymerase sigma factor (sigma-70 family)|nr:sigma-70 family RNA polymerase sigma factor [Tannerella sp.]